MFATEMGEGELNNQQRIYSLSY